MIASGCSANTVINIALGSMLKLVSHLSPIYMEHYVKIYLYITVLFTEISFWYISAMCYVDLVVALIY